MDTSGNTISNYHIGDVTITEDLLIDGDLKVAGAIDGTLELTDLKTKNIIAEDAEGLKLWSENKVNLGLAITDAGIVQMSDDIQVFRIEENSIGQGIEIKNDTTFDVKILVDTINEKTASAGVTIDGVLLKDNEIDVKTAGALNIGDTNATSIQIGKVAVDTVINGSLQTSYLKGVSSGDLSIGLTGTQRILMGNASIITDVFSDLYIDTGRTLFADTIGENTASAGVTIDGVLLKDSQVSTDTINEKTASAGVTIDGVLLKDNEIDVAAAGVLNIGDTNATTINIGKAAVDTTYIGDIRTSGKQYFSNGGDVNYRALYISNTNGTGLTHAFRESTFDNCMYLDVLNGNADEGTSVSNYRFCNVDGSLFLARTTGAFYGRRLDAQSNDPGALEIGQTYATSISLGASAITTSINGTVGLGSVGVGSITANSDITLSQAGGNVSSDNITTNSIQAKNSASVNLATTGTLATAVNIGRSAITTTINGTVAIGTVGVGSISANSDITLSQAGGIVGSDNITTNNIQAKNTASVNLATTGVLATSVNIGRTGIETKINGDLVWAVPHSQVYGGLWSSNTIANVPMTTVTTMTSINTDYIISLTGIISTIAVNFSNSSAGRLTYTGTKTRMFHTAYTISAIDTKNANVSFTVFKNGAITGSQGGTVEIDLGGTSNSTAIHVMVELATNDYIELYGRTSVANNDVTVRYVNMFALSLTS